MFINYDSRVPGNVAGNFFLSLLVDKTSESAHVNIMPAGHGILNDRKEGLYGCRYVGFVDSCLVCNLIDYVCFRHGSGCLGFD